MYLFAFHYCSPIIIFLRSTAIMDLLCARSIWDPTHNSSCHQIWKTWLTLAKILWKLKGLWFLEMWVVLVFTLSFCIGFIGIPSFVRKNTSNLLWRDVGVPKKDKPTPLIIYQSEVSTHVTTQWNYPAFVLLLQLFPALLARHLLLTWELTVLPTSVAKQVSTFWARVRHQLFVGHVSDGAKCSK